MRRARLPNERFKGRLKIIGLKIAYYRKSRDMTQEMLAEQVGYSASYLARVEACGDNDCVVPTLDFLYMVADALGVTLSKLVEEEQNLMS